MGTEKKAEPTQDAGRTMYRAFKKIEPDEDATATVETRDLFELLPGEFTDPKAAHREHGDGDYVLVPLRSFNLRGVRAEQQIRVRVS